MNSTTQCALQNSKVNILAECSRRRVAGHGVGYFSHGAVDRQRRSGRRSGLEGRNFPEMPPGTDSWEREKSCDIEKQDLARTLLLSTTV